MFTLIVAICFTLIGAFALMAHDFRFYLKSVLWLLIYAAGLTAASCICMMHSATPPEEVLNMLLDSSMDAWGMAAFFLLLAGPGLAAIAGAFALFTCFVAGAMVSLGILGLCAYSLYESKAGSTGGGSNSGLKCRVLSLFKQLRSFGGIRLLFVLFLTAGTGACICNNIDYGGGWLTVAEVLAMLGFAFCLIRRARKNLPAQPRLYANLMQ